MTLRRELAKAYAAGFEDGRKSAINVRDEDAGDHAVLGFDGWYVEFHHGASISGDFALKKRHRRKHGGRTATGDLG